MDSENKKRLIPGDGFRSVIHGFTFSRGYVHKSSNPVLILLMLFFFLLALSIMITFSVLSIPLRIISDISGRVILQSNIEQGTKINISTLPAGMYIVSLVSRDGKQTVQLIKK